MNEVDDAILEFFRELGEVGGARVALPPSAVHRHITVEVGSVDRDTSTFSRRMTKLVRRGVLEFADESSGYYRITDKGLAYLADNIDASELRIDDLDDDLANSE